MVGDIEKSFCGVAVDELDAEDFGLREGGVDVDSEVRLFALLVGG